MLLLTVRNAMNDHASSSILSFRMPFFFTNFILLVYKNGKMQWSWKKTALIDGAESFCRQQKMFRRLWFSLWQESIRKCFKPPLADIFMTDMYRLILRMFFLSIQYFHTYVKWHKSLICSFSVHVNIIQKLIKIKKYTFFSVNQTLFLFLFAPLKNICYLCTKNTCYI